MSPHFPALIVVVPLMAAFLVSLAGWIDRRRCLPIAVAALSLCLGTAVALLVMVLEHGVIDYNLGGWKPPVGISYRLDHLNALILVAVAFVALANLVATHVGVAARFSDRLGPFYTLYLLFVTGLFGIVVTGDVFNLFVLLEITSLSGYALIGMGEHNAPLASLNYIFIGTIGASFYLLGVGYLYLVTGSLNMADIAAILPDIYGSRVVTAAFIICLTGLFMKMALFPLHTWMPNAYAGAPAAVSSLVAPLTTKVMIYVMMRMVFSVFTPDYAFDRLQLGDAMVWLAVGAMVMGSLLALSQKKLKRMLAFIIVAEVGYMVGGFWLGNRQAMTGAVLHIVNDAVMTLCVFLAAGSLARQFKSDRLDALKGAFTRMPYTMAAMALGGLSIIGVPPTCGFFSKWYLITGALASGHYVFAAALLFSSLVMAALFFRLFEIAYFEPFIPAREGHGGTTVVAGIQEAPVTMVATMLLTAAVLVLLGFYSGDIVTHIIDPAIPARFF